MFSIENVSLHADEISTCLFLPFFIWYLKKASINLCNNLLNVLKTYELEPSMQS